MAKKYKLQVPMSEELKEKTLTYVKENGFDSMQSLVRLLLTQVVKGDIEIGLHDPIDHIYFPQKFVDDIENDPDSKITYGPFDSLEEMQKSLDENASKI